MQNNEAVSGKERLRGSDSERRRAGARAVQELQPDFIVLDIMLPKRDGWSVCQMVRAQSDVPILMLTARGHVDERVEGLRMGADDYLVKPFDPNELVARVTSILRRTGLRTQVAPAANVYEVGSLRIDSLGHEVTVDGQVVALPKKEYELLLFFVRNPNQVFTREDLISKIWGGISKVRTAWSIYTSND